MQHQSFFMIFLIKKCLFLSTGVHDPASTCERVSSSHGKNLRGLRDSQFLFLFVNHLQTPNCSFLWFPAFCLHLCKEGIRREDPGDPRPSKETLPVRRLQSCCWYFISFPLFCYKLPLSCFWFLFIFFQTPPVSGRLRLRPRSLHQGPQHPRERPDENRRSG